MPLIQIQEGLLERDNFYLTSSFSDFFGTGTYTRSQNTFQLNQGEIKRNFTYQEFVIDVEKEAGTLPNNDQHFFFIEVINLETNVLKKVGFFETQNSSPYWRILCHENFIQTYTSEDGLSWNNAGGYTLLNEQVIFQGFEVIGDTPLIFTDYKVYYNPLLRLQNFEPGHIVELYDANHQLIKTRLFEEDMHAAIFLDFNLEGYLKIYTSHHDLVFTSPLLQFVMGSLYSYTPYILEMRYKNQVINYGPTYLEGSIQLLELKNIGSEAYSNLTILPIKSPDNLDLIELSLDGVIYKEQLNIEQLEAQQVQFIYVRILPTQENTFKVKDFEIKIY